MTADGDFAGFVAARWPRLVRTLVLLGCPEWLAPDVALDALGRCQRGWSRTRGETDVDEVVRGELVAAWDRRRRGGERWWERGPERDHQPTPPGPPAHGVKDLDRMAPEGRTVLVLSRFDGAATSTAAPVAGLVGPTAEELRSYAEQVSVLAPPSLVEIGARRRQNARRRTVRALWLSLATVVPLAVAAAGLTWFADRAPAPQPDRLARLSVAPVADPTNVVWEAGGVVHLPDGTARVPPIRQLAPFGTGALYADRQGRVVELGGDGVRTVLGHEDPDLGFVSSDARGWAAWVDPTGDTPRVVVVDVTARAVIGSLAANNAVRPVAIDGDTVYLADQQGVRGWEPLRQSRPAAVVEPAVLVAATSSVRVYQVGRRQVQMFPYFGVQLPVTGVGGRLSDDGRLLATRTSGAAGGDGPVAIYDTTTGSALRTGVGGDELALDASFGADHTVTYLIARKADRPLANDQLRASFAGALQLRTCQLFLADVAARCDLITDIPVSGVAPMLAH